MIIAYCGGGTYYLQVVGNDFSWNGLKDNATQFHSKIMAEKIIEQFQDRMLLKPIIIIM